MTDSRETDIVERLRSKTTLAYAEVCQAADEIATLRQRVAELEKATGALLRKLQDEDETWLVVQDWVSFHDAIRALGSKTNG